jgi:hypothetical protein
MSGLFSALFAKIAALAQWFIDLFLAVFTAAYDVLKDAVSWVFDQLLSVAFSAIEVLDLSVITQWSSLWLSIPSGVSEVLRALGLGTAFAIISAAIVIRITLQLIPFTRLGS